VPASSSEEVASSSYRAIGRLLHLGWVLLGLLLIECVIGVALAVYVTVPSSPSFMTVFASIPLLTAHIVLAFLLTAVALYATLLARRLRVPGVAAWEALAVLFLLVAIEEGFAFTSSQNNSYVLGMVVGFLGALLVQVVVIYRLTRRSHQPAKAPAVSPGASS
jgi:hypothetical protein